MTAETLKRGWASVVIQRHWRGYRTRQVYQLVRLASLTIQAFTRGWMARKRYKKVGVGRTRVVFGTSATGWALTSFFLTLRWWRSKKP